MHKMICQLMGAVFIAAGMPVELFAEAFSAPFPGSYTTVRPSSVTDPPPPVITPGITGPVLTTDWCASLAFSDTSENMFAHPLIFRCTSTGLELGYARETVVEANYYATPFPRDIGVTVESLPPGKAALDHYTDWSVRASWGGGKMKATMAHGSPFVYFDVSGTVRLSFPAAPKIWYSQPGVLGITIGSRHYGLFAPGGATWNTATPAFTSTLDGKTYCSIAALPDTAAATVAYFKRFAFNFITDTRVSWTYCPAPAGVITTYAASFVAREGNEPSLMFALYPHQWQYFSGKFTAITYNSSRGLMKVVEGTSFVTTQPYNGILPHLPLAATENGTGFKRKMLEDLLAAEVAKRPDVLIRADGDTYWTGKDLGRTSQLVRIADQLGKAGARDTLLDIIKSRLEDWFVFSAGETSECFYYNKTWGTLIGAKPSYDSDKSLNDHHFHYGYFIYAAATVAQYDREWALRWKPMVNLVIRDCDSPLRGDTLFPFMRAFDLYAGHSWASGNALFSSGNNQESTSEAVNFAAATALWGMATGDITMRNLGIFLYTTEKNALLDYWFDVRETVFPESFNHTMVGIVWGEKAAYETWFSAQPECVHGINMLPVTAASLYLGISAAYIEKNYAEIEKNNGGPVDQWFDILWEYRALGAPAEAVKALNAQPDYAPEDGESKAHTYHWIHNLAALGNVDTNITADAPSYAVFNNAGVRHYVVWNPDSVELPVSFSNGKACIVAAQTLVAVDEAQMTSVRSVKPVRSAWKMDRRYNGHGEFRAIMPQGASFPVVVELYDISGKLLDRFIMTSNKQAIPLRRPAGACIVKINGEHPVKWIAP